MSESADDRVGEPARGALARLDEVVGNLLARAEVHRARAREAEERSRELETLLRRFADGDENPAGLQTRISELRKENEDLKARVRKGRDQVERLLARIRFLEEQG